MKDRRIGKFTISKHMIDECPLQVLAVMKDMIIIRAEFLYYSDEVEYVGIHPSFEVKPDGEVPRSYTADIKARSDGTVDSVKWRPWP